MRHDTIEPETEAPETVRLLYELNRVVARANVNALAQAREVKRLRALLLACYTQAGRVACLLPDDPARATEMQELLGMLLDCPRVGTHVEDGI